MNSAGILPLRVTKYMEASRKLGRAHQNVLCFVKGKPPRGWFYDRPAPPDPQLGLGLGEPQDTGTPRYRAQQPAPGPAAEEEPAPVLGGADEDDGAYGPNSASSHPRSR